MMRLTTLVSLALVTTLSLAAMGDAAHAADPTYDQAVASLRSGEYDKAVELLEELLERSPAWVDGHLFLGQVYYLLGEPDRGAESIEVAAEWDPEVDRFGAYFRSGEGLYAQHRFEEAVAPLERALELAPDTEGDERGKSASFRLAQTYLLVNRPADGRALLERYIDLHGVDFRAAYNLGLACKKLGDDRCALENMRRAGARSDETEPSHRKVQEYLAAWSHSWAVRADNAAALEPERLSDAIQATRALYEAEPDDPRSVRYYAETLLVAGRGEDVVRELRPAASREGNCAARLMTARALNSLGEAGEAERWARAAVLCDPTLADAHVELAAAHILHVRPEPAGLAEIRNAEERMTLAIDSLKQALKLEPGHRRATTLLAETEVTLAQLDRVEGDLVASARADEIEKARQRCVGLLWTRRHESRELTAEEETFFRQHDCRQYAR